MDLRNLAVALAITVRVYGEAAVDPDVLAHAKRRVETIFGRAGVGVTWRMCAGTIVDDECSRKPAAAELVVRFLAGQASTSSGDACGVALVPAKEAGHFLSLFVDCIRRAADPLAVAEDVLMGGSLAHELGHLLLGTNSHSPRGIMQAQPRPIDWELAAHDALRFTSEETLRLQRSVAHRTRDLAFDTRQPVLHAADP